MTHHTESIHEKEKSQRVSLDKDIAEVNQGKINCKPCPQKGVTPIHRAAENGLLEMTELSLGKVQKRNLACHNGITLPQRAAQNGQHISSYHEGGKLFKIASLNICRGLFKKEDLLINTIKK